MQATRSTTNSPFLQPTQAWAAILALVIPTALCLLVGFSSILQFLFPAGAFAVAAFLYFRYPTLYLGFTWWVWFLSPFISRMVEYQNGLTDPGLRLIILAPYLATMMTAVTFFKQLPRLPQQGGLPFLLACISLVYAAMIGFAKGNSITEIIQGVLSWLSGVIFGIHLLVNWREYPNYRQNTQRTFFWGVLVMGIYGVYQYVVAPEWDRFWLRNAEDLQLCCGWPEPFMIRVWSTLNYPFTFAYAMMACLLLLFSNQNAFSIPAITAGAVSFLLSLVRGAWVGWLIGLMAFFGTLKPNFKLRLIVTVLSIALFLVPVINMPPFNEAVLTRLQSLSNTSDDFSANERKEIYARLVKSATSEVFGRGMGGAAIIDAGVLDVLATLGWLGIIPYASGIILLFFSLFKYAEARFDSFVNAARATVLSIFVTLPFNNALVLLPSILFWGFSGMALAAHRYHRHQRLLQLNELATSLSAQEPDPSDSQADR